MRRVETTKFWRTGVAARTCGDVGKAVQVSVVIINYCSRHRKQNELDVLNEPVRTSDNILNSIANL
jgi:hypothetical protein